MATTTIIFGLLLTALGLVGYFATGTSSFTALIPSVFGLLLLVLGVAARKETARKNAMHAAAAIGVLGTLAALGGLFRPGASRAGPSFYSQVTMALLLATFTVLCVKSFIDARKARRAGRTAL
jgi:hypothetical protein